MSLPFERSLALVNTRQFLLDLLDPKKTPRIPNKVRKQAYWCLRHYPHLYEIKLIADGKSGIVDDSAGYLARMIEDKETQE